MTSFFDKLKKGMGIEEPIAEPEEEKKETEIKEKPAKKPKRAKKPKKEEKTPEIKVEKIEIQTEEPEEKEPEKIEEKTEEPKEEKKKKWPSFSGMEEGQLAIDVYQTEKDLIIQSAIAGVELENLDISTERDIITIKGEREKPLEEKGDYFLQECFWGPFSREIILPTEADPGRAEAEMKNGILTIKIPKVIREKKRKIIIKKQ